MYNNKNVLLQQISMFVRLTSIFFIIITTFDIIYYSNIVLSLMFSVLMCSNPAFRII